jgi:hypothetical protein
MVLYFFFFRMLNLLMTCGNGDCTKHPRSRYVKVRAFALEPRQVPVVIGVDGEVDIFVIFVVLFVYEIFHF